MRRLSISPLVKFILHLLIIVFFGINSAYAAISASATQGTLLGEVRVTATGSTIQSVPGYACTMSLARNGTNIQQVSCDSFNANGGYFTDSTVSGIIQYNYTATLNNYRLEDHGYLYDQGSWVDQGWWVDQGSTVDQGWWVDQGSTVDQGWWVDQGSWVDQGWWVDQGSWVDQGWWENQGYYTLVMYVDPGCFYYGDDYCLGSIWVDNMVWHSNPVWVSNWVWHSNPVWVANWVWHSNPVWVSNMVWHSNPVWVANWVWHSNPVWVSNWIWIANWVYSAYTENSNTVTGWAKDPIPPQVTGLTATKDAYYGKVALSWSAATYAIQYDLYKSTQLGTKGSLIASDIPDTSFDDANLTDDTHYFYTVVSKNKTGIAPDSAQADGWGKGLTAINTLTATKGTITGAVRLNWTTNPDATSYDVYRSGARVSDGAFELIANVSANTYLDAHADTTMFFYKVIAKRSSVSSPFGTEASGWANVAVTSATVEISTDWQTKIQDIAPTITDPNVAAGQAELFTIEVTNQPVAGSVAVVSGAFVFTPPADGLFSGDQNFGFTVTDKGGAFVDATGVIHVACAAPTIHSSAVEEGSILPVSTFTGTAKFSLPTCGSNGQITIDVLNADGTVLLAGESAPVGNGADIIKSTVTKGPLVAGNYLARFTVQNNLGTVTATRPLKVDPVIPPTMAISPALTVVSGVDVVNATLSSPDDFNCPFVSDQAAAISDASKCFVQFDDIPPGMVADANQSLPSLAGIVTDDGNYPITAGVYRFDGTIPVKVASVTENITTTCDAPVITHLTAPDGKLPYLIPTYGFKYTAHTCNNSLTTNVNIYKGIDTQGDLVQSIPVALSVFGDNKLFAVDGVGLDDGNYTAEVTLTGSAGTAKKSVTFTVKKVPLPTIDVSPPEADQMETKVSATIKPALDNYSCPLTTDQTVAENDPNHCFVVLSNNISGMNAGFSKNGLPMLSGYPAIVGSHSITGTLSRWVNGVRYDLPVPPATITTSCDAPSIAHLIVPNNELPWLIPTYEFKYTAHTCNNSLTTNVNIYKGIDTQGDLVQSIPVALGEYGANKTYAVDGVGLEEGNYTAEVTLTGSAGTAKKSVTFTVKKVPLPTIDVSPTEADQLETKVSVTLKPALDNYSCPLTTDQTVAENDPNHCFVVLSNNISGMNAGFSKNGLPMLSGYPVIVGSHSITGTLSRWVNGVRYDLPVPPTTLTVKATEPMVFTLQGNTSAYLGIEAIDLEVRQTQGLSCSLQTDMEKAKKVAATGIRTCFVTFITPDEMAVSTNSTNQAKATGVFSITGEKALSYTVDRVFTDGMTRRLGEGEKTITIKDLPAPIMHFQGGNKITENKYYVEQGASVTRAVIDAGIPTKAKLQISVTDKYKTTLRTNMMTGNYYWVTTSPLKLLEEQPITVRLAWSAYPSVYTERTLIAVGGTEGNLKLVAEAPLKTSDTQNFNVKVKLGKYVKNSLIYTPETMGQWKTQIMMQSSTQSTKVPITEIKDLANGEAEFSINPAGYTYLKLTAVSELVSNVDGLDILLSSVTRYIEIVKGSAIEGSISSKSLDGPAPKTFVLNLDMTAANRGAVKEVIWEESEDDGATWAVVKKSNTIRYNVIMENPGKRKVRLKMINKNTLIESYTDPVEVWSYAALDARIIGPNHMAPNFSATFAGELFRAGEKTTDTVNEWTIVAPSGTTTSIGDTATITETQEGKVYITLKTRPADTRADDARAWTVAKYYLTVKTPTKPSVSTNGPRDVETGKTYHYNGIVKPSWGDAGSVHAVKSEWQLPNGTIVEGASLDWTPSTQNVTSPKPLTFRAWVDGFKDSTTSETMVNYAPWEYVWPKFTVSMRQLTVQAPSDIIMMITHDRADMNRRFEELTYEWSLPDNVTGRYSDAFPNRAVIQALYAGEYDITVTVTDARGHKSVLTQHIVAEQAVPYNVTLKIGKSNFFERAPMTVTVRPVIAGGHPLDSVIGQMWSVDGVLMTDYVNRDFMVSDIADAGDHVISYTLTSKMGVTATINSPLHLLQNQPPTCELAVNSTVYMAYAEAKCTDLDGKVIGYSWQVNGQPIGSTSYRISFIKSNTPQSATVTIIAMDDAKEQSTPVSIGVNY